jgi:hypothetical protein
MVQEMGLGPWAAVGTGAMERRCEWGWGGVAWRASDACLAAKNVAMVVMDQGESTEMWIPHRLGQAGDGVATATDDQRC